MSFPTYVFIFRIVIFVLLLAIAYVDWQRDLLREEVFRQAQDIVRTEDFKRELMRVRR